MCIHSTDPVVKVVGNHQAAHLAPIPSVTRRSDWKLFQRGNWSSFVAGVTSAPTTLTERCGTSAMGISVPSNCGVLSQQTF